MSDEEKDNKTINDKIWLIEKFFGDLLASHQFALTKKSVHGICYENKYYKITYVYTFRWKDMIFDGIGIIIRRNMREYSLTDIVEAIHKDSGSSFFFSEELDKKKPGVSNLEKYRIISGRYLDAILDDKNASWESAVQQYLKKKFAWMHSPKS